MHLGKAFTRFDTVGVFDRATGQTPRDESVSVSRRSAQLEDGWRVIDME
jgi:hypothetical protein